MSCFGFRQGLALVVQPLFHPLPGLTYFLCLAKEAGCWWCILCFVPWRGRLTFFVLPKKVSKERRARDGDPLLEFLLRGGRGGKLAALKQPPLFFLPVTKIQGAI
ncbi:hypothetical protein A3768_3426 [Ralstonia solanacearum]|nr:hypothetical protein F504_282 [Ralstonia pseudosolanacearum FQY_4]ANH34545.1 hypothetical protein A3768_3426 [Ralstonia solanacearum]